MDQVKQEKFKEGVKGFFNAIGAVCAEFNDGKEWLSATMNITANPQGEAPIITSIVLPGTTKEHAKKIQENQARMFLDMNKENS